MSLRLLLLYTPVATEVCQLRLTCDLHENTHTVPVMGFIFVHVCHPKHSNTVAFKKNQIPRRVVFGVVVIIVLNRISGRVHSLAFPTTSTLLMPYLFVYGQRVSHLNGKTPGTRYYS